MYVRPNYFSFSLFLSLLITAVTCFGEDLPSDAGVSIGVIQNKKYPSKFHHTLRVGYGYLYGDKFLDTKGFNLHYSLFFSEELGAELGAHYFLHSFTDDKERSGFTGYPNGTPYYDYWKNTSYTGFFDPTWIFKAYALYQPIYGKFSIFNRVQHFNAGFKLGLAYHLMDEIDFYTEKTRKRLGALGFGGGLFVHIPLSEWIVLGADAELVLVPTTPEIDGQSSTRKEVLTQMNIGLRL